MDGPINDADGLMGQGGLVAKFATHVAHRSHIELAYAVNRSAHRVTFSPDLRDGRSMTAGALWCKLLEDFQSVVVLEERGLENQAWVLLRVTFEAVVHLVLVREDAAYWEEYRASQDFSRHKSLKALIAGRTGGTLSVEDVDAIREGLKEVGRPDRQADLEDLLVRIARLERRRLGKPGPVGSGLSELHATLYSLASLCVHSAPAVLEQYWTVDQDGLVNGFRHGALIDDVILVLLSAIRLLIIALSSVSALFPDFTATSDLEDVVARFSAAWKAMEAASASV